MVQDVKNVLIQNKEEQHWKSLLEKVLNMHIDTCMQARMYVRVHACTQCTHTDTLTHTGAH